MRRPTRCFWLTLAGLALVGLAPSSARASCGHYVIIGSPLKDEAGKSSTQPTMPHGATQQNPIVPVHPGPKPCSGPGCSQRGEPLLPPPAAPTSIDEERWGHDLRGTVSTEHPTDFLTLPLTAARTVRFVSAVFHPPR